MRGGRRSELRPRTGSSFDALQRRAVVASASRAAMISATTRWPAAFQCPSPAMMTRSTLPERLAASRPGKEIEDFDPCALGACIEGLPVSGLAARGRFVAPFVQFSNTWYIGHDEANLPRGTISLPAFQIVPRDR